MSKELGESLKPDTSEGYTISELSFWCLIALAFVLGLLA